MAGVLGCGVVVCCLNEGDDEILDRREELVRWSASIKPRKPFDVFIVDRLTSSTSPARCNPWPWPFAGREGIDEPFVTIVTVQTHSINVNSVGK